MEINDLLRYVREAQGIRLGFVSKLIGKTHTALSRFETGKKKSISTENVRKVAEHLQIIDVDFLDGTSSNPFKKTEHLVKLYGMYLMGRSWGIFAPLNILIEYNKRLEFVSLVPKFTGVDKIIKHGMSRLLLAIGLLAGGEIKNVPTALAGKFVYAIAVRDSIGNYYVVRSKDKDEFLLWEGGDKDLSFFVNSYTEMLGITSDRAFSFSRKEINKQLYQSIRDWNSLKKEDILPFFSQDIISTLNEEERGLAADVILAVRDGRCSPEEIKSFLVAENGERES